MPRLQAPRPLRTRPQRYARSHAHSLTAAQDAPDADTARTTELQSLKRLVEDIYEGDVCGGFREFRLMSRAGPWCRAVVQGRGAGPRCRAVVESRAVVGAPRGLARLGAAWGTLWR